MPERLESVPIDHRWSEDRRRLRQRMTAGRLRFLPHRRFAVCDAPQRLSAELRVPHPMFPVPPAARPEWTAAEIELPNVPPAGETACQEGRLHQNQILDHDPPAGLKTVPDQAVRDQLFPVHDCEESPQTPDSCRDSRQLSPDNFAAAKLSIIGSRSTPIRRPAGPRTLRIRLLWPAAPTVPSRTVRPGDNCSHCSTSRGITGIWTGRESAGMGKTIAEKELNSAAVAAVKVYAARSLWERSVPASAGIP